MELFQDVCYILAGLGVFLLGMHLMGDGLRKSAGKSLKTLFDHLNNRKIVSFGIGMGVTTVVQASGATTVVAMGLVNAGLMSLPVALAVCLGAKVGTTATGLLASLSSLPLSSVFCAIGLVGVCLILFGKKDSIVQIGYIIAGFGTLFAGMYLVKSAISSNEDIMNSFQAMFQAINIPPLLVLIGIVVTALLQSSSTVSVMLIALISANAITFDAGMFILVGASVGTCITGVLASIGASKDAIRLAVMNTLDAASTALVLGGIIWASNSLFLVGDKGVISYVFGLIESPTWSLSIFGFVYNLVAALAVLPFTTPIAALSRKIIPDKPGEVAVLRTYYIDDRLFKTPALAAMQVKKEIWNMGRMATENLSRGLNALIDGDFSELSQLSHQEEQIDFITKKVSNYLVSLAGLELSAKMERQVGAFHHVIDDMERIGDHAENFGEQAEKMKREAIHFSGAAIEELKQMRESVLKMAESTLEIFESEDDKRLPGITDMENAIDKMKKDFSNNHVDRLNSGGCDIETGTYFYSAIEALERVGDHLVNIAFSIRSITGSQKEAYAFMSQEQ
ncbi:MAG: Na/Pi cotransporter family protein [Clostridia bacterium]|nr:Na/Pi cotransporter family protein [Clostridia bacterium]